MTALTLGQLAPARGQGKAKSNAKSAPARPADISIPFQAQQSPLFFFKRETFEPYVGGIFVARAGSNSARLKLVEVRDCTPKASTKLTTGRAPRTDCFALEFSSEEQLTDLTSIYDIEHGALGQFPLFMTRRDGPEGTSLYEAVFNHLVQP